MPCHIECHLLWPDLEDQDSGFDGSHMCSISDMSLLRPGLEDYRHYRIRTILFFCFVFVAIVVVVSLYLTCGHVPF